MPEKFLAEPDRRAVDWHLIRHFPQLHESHARPAVDAFPWRGPAWMPDTSATGSPSRPVAQAWTRTG